MSNPCDMHTWHTYPEDTLCLVREKRCQVFWVEIYEAVYEEEQQDTEIEKHDDCIHERAFFEPPCCNQRHQYYQCHS